MNLQSFPSTYWGRRKGKNEHNILRMKTFRDDLDLSPLKTDNWNFHLDLKEKGVAFKANLASMPPSGSKIRKISCRILWLNWQACQSVSFLLSPLFFFFFFTLYWTCYSIASVLFWVSGHKPCEMLVPHLGMESVPHVLEGEALSVGPPAKAPPLLMRLNLRQNAARKGIAPLWLLICSDMGKILWGRQLSPKQYPQENF